MSANLEELPPEHYKNVLLVRKNQLEYLIKVKKKEIADAPEGRLRVSTNKGHFQYYKVSDAIKNPGTYLGKNNLNEAALLARADYNRKILPYLQQEVDIINNLLKHSSNLHLCYDSFHLGRRKLFQPVTLPDEEYKKLWQSKEYKHKTFEQTDIVLLASNGQRVRSKSEMIIADTLSRFEIPYRYEYPVKLKNYTVHPDFLCLNIRTRQEYIWEHFGLMDNPEYQQNAFSKIADYQNCGYFPGKNLILTFETIKNPLSAKQVSQLTKEYLL